MRAAGRLLLLLGVAGCRQILGIDESAGTGLGGAAPTGPLPEEVAAAQVLAAKDCAGWEACVPISFAARFASQADCIEKNKVFWASQFFGPDSGATLSDLEQCGAELDVTSCTAWWSFSFAATAMACYRASVTNCENSRVLTFGAAPASCYPKGSRGFGEPCGAGSQCQSGLCYMRTTPGLDCGACLAAGGEDESCQGNLGCSPGLACGGAAACVPLSGAGDPCSGGCLVPSLACDGATCEPRLFDAPSCDPAFDAVSHAQCKPDHVCNAESLLCEPLEAQKLGEPCGLLDGGGIGHCELGAACRVDPVQPNTARCEPAIPLGGACTTAYLFGNGCQYPADCVSGTCRLRGPETCPAGLP